MNLNIYYIEAHKIDIVCKSINIDQGLSQSTVEALFQDSKGYIWIGTNHGLNRYDGYDFKIYKRSENKENSIVSNYIHDIKEDSEGNIWVGTIKGVSKINSKDDKIVNYLDSPEQGNLSHYNTSEILITKSKQILVATADGLNLYNKDSDRFERILDGKDDLTSQDIYSLAEDENGDLWIGTNKGLNKVSSKEKKIDRFYKNEEEKSIISNKISKVYSDKIGNIWVGTFDNGLSKINIHTNEISNYKKIENDENSLPGQTIRDILLDSKNNIWVCTNLGLAKYIEKSDSFVSYYNDKNDKYSLISDSTFTALQDSSGLIWIGTYEGISVFNPNNNIKHYKMNSNNKEFLNSNIIHGIYEDDESLWVGTVSEGLNIIDRKKDTVAYISEEEGLSNNRVNFIVGDKSYVWVATNDGLNRINKKDKSIKVYTEEDGLNEYRVKSILLDSNGNLWIGTPGGLNILDTKTDKITDANYILEKNNIRDKYIQCIYEDIDGNYWLGTFIDGSLIKIDIENKKVTNYKIDGNSIRSIAEYKNYLWLGTNYGLDRFDKKTGQLKKYTQENGLSNDMVYGVIMDEDENIWMSTNYGISKFDIKKDTFTNYNISDGFQSNEFNGGAYFKNSKGEILFGGINGLNIFNPKEISINNYVPRVNFEEFIVKEKSYKNINNLKFNYSDNEIEIKFFLPQYKDSNKTTYYYKIEGQDETWKSTKNNEIIYKNLKSGNYTFKIKAKNHNGIMSEESIIKFIIKPHILLSKLAFFIYMIIIILIIYINLNKMKRLDKLVDKRTKQLREEMEKNNNLLNKIIKLEKNKNNYFINLSHELRTPLNVISTTQQLILALNKKEQGISKERINYHTNTMQKNTKRLLNLINNIIDTSKIEYGNYKINVKEENIVNIVEETALSLKDYVESKNIELIIDPEIEEKIIECDKDEIERCIVNLISNAKKFTPDGGKIKVSIEDLGEKVKICVEDTGVGIEPKYQKFIFDRFNQIVDNKSELKGGSGLGLTITKQIIDLHKGEAFVESELNKGSKFIIILPTKIKK
ncbi:ligand-binding sensor domain-containing protein [Romboutsia sp.]|uniref:ligand-binding sensor domain-containing protein n=1 Tax=Romboutsia sp. TaxID=1965302 RepID=UPI003F67BB2A